MGCITSSSKVSATLCVPSADLLVDKLRLSCRRATCCGVKEKTLAAFTFPSGGWHPLPGGVLVNGSAEVVPLSLGKVSCKDAFQRVKVSGLAGGESVLTASLLLGDLLPALTCGPQAGRVSSLNFTLERVCCYDEAPVDGGLLLAGSAELQCSSPGLRYALYCNGWLCMETDMNQRGSHTPAVLQERDGTTLDVKQSQVTTHNTPAVSALRVTSLSVVENFQARVIVHRVDDIVQFGEIFPDIYVKVRMKEPPSTWFRTDVHKKCINSTALFEYRLVLPLFPYPAMPVKQGLCKQPRRLPPTLQIILMDEDQLTRDDKLGGVSLNLEDLVLPDDKESCGVATLSNERVSLFDVAALRRARSKDAVFPRELTGYWPLLKKKKLNRELKTVGSISLTIQLLTASEAAKFPAATGNRPWSANRYPRLKRPRREHGRIRDKVVLGVIQNVEQVIAHTTGIPSIKVFVILVVVIVLVVMNVKPSQLKALATTAYLNGRDLFDQHPNKTKFLIFFYAISCVAWIFMKRGFGSSKKQNPVSSTE